MAWQEQSVMSLRQEFVELAGREDANVREVCRRAGISAKTGDTWLGRAAAGAAGLADRSRRPRAAPAKTAEATEARVLAVRAEHPPWGGRKIHWWPRQHGVADAPAPSTITDILRRHGLLALNPDAPRRWVRFAHAAPNDLWPLDFMGHRPVAEGRRVRPPTLRDDHSRFALLLAACACEQQAVVQGHLAGCFRRYGLPRAILTDTGPPWGTSGAGGLTAPEAWLLRLGVELWHGRAGHPQTQGEGERFHAPIAADVFARRTFADVPACQPAFAAFRATSNLERPHAALPDHATPASRDAASPRPSPAALPPVAYGPADRVRVVRGQGAISFGNRSWFVSRGLGGQPVAVRPTTDGHFRVYDGPRHVATIDPGDADEVYPMSPHTRYPSPRSLQRHRGIARSRQTSLHQQPITSSASCAGSLTPLPAGLRAGFRDPPICPLDMHSGRLLG
jgi:transposase InsO family protein